MSEQPKKKGVKPGTKRGSYKKTTVNLSSDQSVNDTFERLSSDLKSEQEKNQNLNSEINSLRDRLNECEKMNIDLEHKLFIEPKIDPIKQPQFIYDPSPVFNQMNRVIAYEIKEGNLNKGDNVLQKFTTNAIKYYIQNEFNHILK